MTITVKLTIPVKSFPVGSELGFEDIETADKILGSDSYDQVGISAGGDDPEPEKEAEDLSNKETGQESEQDPDDDQLASQVGVD